MIKFILEMSTVLISWVIALGFFIPAVFLIGSVRAFVFYKLWNWLLVPSVHVPDINFIKAFCIMFVYNFLIAETGKKQPAKYYVNSIANQAFILLIGYIIHLFI